MAMAIVQLVSFFQLSTEQEALVAARRYLSDVLAAVA